MKEPVDLMFGIGARGFHELFGGCVACSLYIPDSFKSQLEDKLGNIYKKKKMDDYDVFEVLNTLFPNYKENGITLVDWLTKSHNGNREMVDGVMEEMTLDKTLVVNILSNHPNYEVTKDNIVAYILYVPPETINTSKASIDTIDSFSRFLEMSSFVLMCDEIKVSADSLIEATSSEECLKYLSSLEAEHELPFAMKLSSAIARAAYITQIQELEVRYDVSIPRGIGKAAIEFYYEQCEKMNHDDKFNLMKLFIIEAEEK